MNRGGVQGTRKTKRQSLFLPPVSAETAHYELQLHTCPIFPHIKWEKETEPICFVVPNMWSSQNDALRLIFKDMQSLNWPVSTSVTLQCSWMIYVFMLMRFYTTLGKKCVRLAYQCERAQLSRLGSHKLWRGIFREARLLYTSSGSWEMAGCCFRSSSLPNICIRRWSTTAKC